MPSEHPVHRADFSSKADVNCHSAMSVRPPVRPGQGGPRPPPPPREFHRLRSGFREEERPAAAAAAADAAADRPRPCVRQTEARRGVALVGGNVLFGLFRVNTLSFMDGVILQNIFA